MKLVVLGLSLSSSWGNGHATTYRALLRAFAARGHDVLFLERDVAWYQDNRDLSRPDYCRLCFYRDLAHLDLEWRAAVASADAVMVGSFTPEGVAVGRWVQAHALGLTCFYDIDTPVTLAALERDESPYMSRDILPGYALYLSFTGGPSLTRLEEAFGARSARPLYCSVDEATYRPTGGPLRWDLSYLGTYSPDRQPTLDRLLLEVAREAPDLKFCVAGPQYPDDLAWPANVERISHVAPAEHPAFYSSSRYSLNVTRADMITAGYGPSVRLFEAAACGSPLISDAWPGIETLLEPGREIVIAQAPADVLAVLRTASETARQAQAQAARARILAEHTAAHRAAELEALLLTPADGQAAPRAQMAGLAPAPAAG